MVYIQLKKDSSDQFLYRTTSSISIKDLHRELVNIYNGRLKVERICVEIEQLSEYGPMFPKKTLYLTPDEIQEMELIKEWESKCFISENTYKPVIDPSGRRTGTKASFFSCRLLKSAVKKARSMISKNLISKNEVITMKTIDEAIELLHTTVLDVYPQNLPPYDIIRLEFEDDDNLLEPNAFQNIADTKTTSLWFSGHKMYSIRTLADYIGQNEDKKIIVKLENLRTHQLLCEPFLSGNEKKELPFNGLKRTQSGEFVQGHFMNSESADNKALKKICYSLDNFKLKRN